MYGKVPTLQYPSTLYLQLKCKKENSDDLHYGLELIHGIQRYNMELCGLKLYHGLYWHTHGL